MELAFITSGCYLRHRSSGVLLFLRPGSLVRELEEQEKEKYIRVKYESTDQISKFEHYKNCNYKINGEQILIHRKTDHSIKIILTHA